MKNSLNLFLFFFMMVSCFSSFAQAEDDIVGVWKTGEGNAMVQIKKAKSGTYFGRVVWLKEPNDENGNPKVDKNNPDTSKRSNKVLGLINLIGFKYKGDGKWEDGTIYDPKNGETYNCQIEMPNNNTLEVRGYIGVSLFGRTDTWTRQTKK